MIGKKEIVCLHGYYHNLQTDMSMFAACLPPSGGKKNTTKIKKHKILHFSN